MEKPIQLLLVEDNPGDARLLRELLKEITTAQFDITLVGRLSEALSKLRDRSFDLVLTDLSLPGQKPNECVLPKQSEELSLMPHEQRHL